MQTKAAAHFAALGVIAALVSSALLLDWLAPADRAALDAQFRLLRSVARIEAKSGIAIVGIDEESLRSVPEPLSLWHGHIGRLLEVLAGAKPAAVGLDVVLPERSFDQVAPRYDQELLRGLIVARRAYPLVVALTADDAGKQRGIHAPFLALAGPERAGMALLPVDPDGIIRRFDERLGAGGAPVPTLAGQMVRALGGTPHNGLIQYAHGELLPYVPFHRVIQWARDGNETALHAAFAGKAVLLGVMIPHLDRHRAPLPLSAEDPAGFTSPGVLIHAQAIRNMAEGKLIEPVGKAALAGLAALLALLWFVRRPAVAVVAVVLAVPGIYALSAVLLLRGWYLAPAVPAFAALLGAGGRVLFESFVRLRERRRLRSLFSGYVSPPLMREILAGRLKPGLSGEKRFVCLMFCDIRGYTTRSEKMRPEDIVGLLNRYFESVVAILHRHDGCVLSFMGDGFMAIFGAPNQLANPCQSAFNASLDLLELVKGLSADLVREGGEPIAIGIGLHAGPAVVGHVGSRDRHEYTAIGDVTNVASRLESHTKEAGYSLVVSSSVAPHLDGSHALAPLGFANIKGHSPVEAFGYGRVQ